MIPELQIFTPYLIYKIIFFILISNTVTKYPLNGPKDLSSEILYSLTGLKTILSHLTFYFKSFLPLLSPYVNLFPFVTHFIEIHDGCSHLTLNLHNKIVINIFPKNQFMETKQKINLWRQSS
jgi:hypothetical protein